LKISFHFISDVDKFANYNINFFIQIEL